MLLSSIKSLITLADIILLKASQYYLVLLKAKGRDLSAVLERFQYYLVLLKAIEPDV